MTLKLTKPGQMVPRYLTALFFGVPGTRKSTLANSAPGPVLPIALDEGYGRSKWAHDALTPADVPTWEALLSAVTPDELAGYETVIVDPIAYLVDLADDYIRRTTPKASLPGGGFTFQGWGARNKALLDFLKMMKPHCNRVFLAHETTDDTDDTRKIRPIIPGKAFQVITQDCDLIGRTMPIGNGDGERYAVEFRANDRCDLLKSTGGVLYAADVGDDEQPAQLAKLFAQTKDGLRAQNSAREAETAGLREWQARIAEAGTADLTAIVAELEEAAPMEKAFVRPTAWERAKAIGAQYDREKREFYIPVEEPGPDAAEVEAEVADAVIDSMTETDHSDQMEIS